MSKRIYLDNASTTYPKPEVLYTQLDNLNRNYSINSGRGSYAIARETTDLIEEVRNELSKIVNAKDTVFCSSVTMAMNQIINGLDIVESSNVYYSPYEHNAVMRTLFHLQKNFNFNLIEMPLQKESLEIDLAMLSYMFAKDKPDFVFCIHCSNVTGYVLPVKEIGELLAKYDTCYVVDAAQSFFALPLDIIKMNIDFVTFAGHKTLYGPFGVGGYCTNNKYKLKHYYIGGTGSDSLNLEMPIGTVGYEPSSHNSVAIISLLTTIKWLNENQNNEDKLLDYLISELNELDDLILYRVNKECRHAIVSFNINGYTSQEVGKILDDEFNICVRTGYHCCPGIHKYLGDEKFLGTIRVGLGKFNHKQEIDLLVKALEDIIDG